MTFDPGGPDGSGPPLQKKKRRRGRRFSVDKRIHYFFSFSLGGLQKVRALIAKVAVESSRARCGALPLASPLVRARVRETRVARVRRSEEETNSWHRTSRRASDRRRPLLSRRVVPAGRRRGNLFTTEFLILLSPSLPLLLLLLPPRWDAALPSLLLPLSPLPLPLGSLSNREQESPGVAARCQ